MVSRCGEERTTEDTDDAGVLVCTPQRETLGLGYREKLWMLPPFPARINNQTNESFTPTLYCLSVPTVVHVVVHVILSVEECEAGYTFASYKKHNEQVEDNNSID